VSSGPLPRLTAASTRLEVLKQLGEAFRDAGIDTAQRDARLLLLHAVGARHADLLKEPRLPIGEPAARQLTDHAARRIAREPVARILGEWEFWSLPFVVTADTLVPRPDSETVVAAALTTLGPRRQSSEGLRVLDLGTGSGCLLIALLHELQGARGIGTDMSEGALETARFNATRNGIGDRAQFVQTDWASGIAGSFDLVVSNPPYIPDAIIDTLEPEVRDHDPRRALSGGRDGLQAYRTIATSLGPLLAPGGRAVIEIGSDQSETVSRLFRDAGFTVEGPFLDFGHRPRALALSPSGPARA
jgi:release factor glutamine methyltransferase